MQVTATVVEPDSSWRRSRAAALAGVGRPAAAQRRHALKPAAMSEFESEVDSAAGVDDDEPFPPSMSKGPIVVLWTVQTSCILLTSIAVGYSLITLKFLLVPLLMAYFVIFLMAPILDIMEKRPLKACFGELPDEAEQNNYEKTYESKMLCVAGYENERRMNIVKKLNARTPAQQKVATPLDGQLAMAELTLMAQIPHALASVLTLIVCCVILGICGSVRCSHCLTAPHSNPSASHPSAHADHSGWRTRGSQRLPRWTAARPSVELGSSSVR
jgi:hypothetical protein